MLRLAPDGEVIDDLVGVRIDDIHRAAAAVRDVDAIGKTFYRRAEAAGFGVNILRIPDRRHAWQTGGRNESSCVRKDKIKKGKCCASHAMRIAPRSIRDEERGGR